MLKTHTILGVITLAVAFVALGLVSLPVVAAGSINFSYNNINISENVYSTNYNRDFSVQLTPEPTDDVTVKYSTDGQCTLAYGDDSHTENGQLASQGSFFSFEVRAVDDNLKEGPHKCKTTFNVISADSNYANLTKSLTFNVADDGDTFDGPAVTTELTNQGSLGEGSGGIVTFKLNANTAPADPVTLTAYGGTQCEMIVDGQRQSSDSATLDSGQTATKQFTVSARDDDIYEGSHSCVVSFSVTTNDLDFAGLSVNPLVFSLSDNDPTYLQEQAAAARQAELEEYLSQDFGIIDALDGNNDGTPDSEQPNVQTFINSVSAQRNAVVVEGCNIDGSVVSSPEDELAKAHSLHFPNGYLDFTLQCPDQGATAKVSWLLEQQYPSDFGWLLRKVTDSSINVIKGAEIATFDVQNGRVTSVAYQVEDGGPLDLDGEVNGRIVDPIGLGLPVTELGQAATTEPAGGSVAKAAILSLALVGGVLLAAWLISTEKARSWLNEKIFKRGLDEPRVDRF